MTAENENKQEGIPPELAAKGFWNEGAPKPPEPEAKKEPEKEPEKTEEPPKEPEPAKKEEPKPEAPDEKRSRRKARIAELINKRNATLELIKNAGEDKALAAVHTARSEEQHADIEAAIAESEAEYLAKLEKAIPEPDVREATIEYARKYSPEIELKAPDFAEWWLEQPMHFETLTGLYHLFGEKKLLLSDFLEKTDFDKKRLIKDIANAITELKAKGAKPKESEEKPSEQKKPEPLPKVEGDSPKVAGDEMQTIYDQQRARRVQKYSGK